MKKIVLVTVFLITACVSMPVSVSENTIAACQKKNVAMAIERPVFFDRLEFESEGTRYRFEEKVPEKAKNLKMHFIGDRSDELAVQTISAFLEKLEERLKENKISISASAPIKIETDMARGVKPVYGGLEEVRFLVIKVRIPNNDDADGEPLFESILMASSALPVITFLPSARIEPSKRDAAGIAVELADSLASHFCSEAMSPAEGAAAAGDQAGAAAASFFRD